MVPGQHEVVVHQRIGQGDRRQPGRRAVGDAIGRERGLGAIVDAEIEQLAALGIDLGMGGERLQHAAEIKRALCPHIPGLSTPRP